LRPLSPELSPTWQLLPQLVLQQIIFRCWGSICTGVIFTRRRSLFISRNT